VPPPTRPTPPEPHMVGPFMNTPLPETGAGSDG